MQSSTGVTWGLVCAVAAALGISLMSGCVTAEPKAGHDEPEAPKLRESAVPTGIAKCDRELQTQVSRQEVQALIDDRERLERLVRIRPHQDSNGDHDGFELFSVDEDGMLYRAGVRNGDVVTHLAGQSVGRVFGAIEAVKGMLSDATREVDVRIMRLDQQVCLTVMIQD